MFAGEYARRAALVVAFALTAGSGCADGVFWADYEQEQNQKDKSEANKPLDSDNLGGPQWGGKLGCADTIGIDGRFTGFDDELSWAGCLKAHCGLAEPCFGKACETHRLCIDKHCDGSKLYPHGSHEWAGTKPVKGMYGIFYTRWSNGRLFVLNDWLLRDDQDIWAKGHSCNHRERAGIFRR